MAEKLQVVSEENNQYILKNLNQKDASQDSHEKKSFLDAIMAYLIKLNSFMVEAKTCDILKQLPSTGKLLSKLCKTLNNEDQIFDILVDCIFHLSNIPESLNSSSNIERKVGQWAAEQLQVCSASCMKSEDVYFMDILGTSQSDIMDAQISEIPSMIICEEVLEGNETEECCLCTVTKMVLPFLDEPRVKKMIDSILIGAKKAFKRISKKSNHCSLKHFLDEVAKNRSIVRGLSDVSRICLWQCHLPAFELEILDMVKLVINSLFADNESIMKTLKEQHPLVLNYCSQHLLFYECAEDILRASICEFGCCTSLTSLIHLFHILVNKEKIQGKTLGCNVSDRPFPSLPLSLDGTTCQEKESAIAMMAGAIKHSYDSKRFTSFEIWFAIVQNKHYIKHALQLSLHGSIVALDSILEILIAFYFPKSKSNATASNYSSIKKCFKSFIMNIRCLLHKKILQASDMAYPINLCKKGMPNSNNLMPDLLQDLVFHFLVDANASHCILREIFSSVTMDLPYRIRLDLWLRTMEDKFLSNRDKNLLFQEENFCEDKRHTFFIFTSCLLDYAKTELSDMGLEALHDEKGEHSQQLINRVNCISNLLNPSNNCTIQS